MNDLLKLLENHQLTHWLCGGTALLPGGSETRTERRGWTQTPPPPFPPTRLRPPRPAEQLPFRFRERSGDVIAVARRSTSHAMALERETCPCTRPACPTGEEEPASVPPAGPMNEPSPRACRYGWDGTTPMPSSTLEVWSMWSRWVASTAKLRPTPRAVSPYKPRRGPSRSRPGWCLTCPCPY